MRINAPIDVAVKNGAPHRIRLGRRIYHVRRRLDYWVVQSRWWGREEKRLYFRLETDRGIIEVYRATEFDRDFQKGNAGGTSRNDAGSTSGGDAGADGCGGGSGGGADAGGGSDSRNAPDKPSVYHIIEGDTHTRVLRRTDLAYRPDAKQPNTSHSTLHPVRRHWVLSKIID